MNPMRGGRKIRPPRIGRTGLKGKDDFDAKWKVLTASINQIHTKEVSKLSYEELYRNAHYLVLTKWSETLYKNVKKQEEEWLGGTVQPRLQKFLVTSILLNAAAGASQGTSTNERRMAGERLLKEIKEAWNDHMLCTGMITDVLMYLDRAYCWEQRLPTLSTVELALFRDYVLLAPITIDTYTLSVLDTLVHVILDHVQMERRGEITDKGLVKSCVDMLDMILDANSQSENDRLYATRFEKAFLDASHDFYKSEGETVLQELDAGTYCRHAWRRLSEERDRCQSMLSGATAPKIEKIVVDLLFDSKVRALVKKESGVRHMADNDRYDELKLIYELNAKIDVYKSELTRELQKRICELGNEINNEVAIAAQPRPAPTPTTAEGEKSKAPPDKNLNLLTTAAMKWVGDILALKDKFDIMWERSFDRDQLVHNAMARSFAEFINNCSRCSEYISLFIDDNMKKGIKGKTESEIDAVLEKAIIILRYVQDKDFFERYYKKHLCKRLLYNKSLSNDVEKQMISRLKIELGNTFTGKLETMFKDMSISEELTSEYKAHVSNLGDADPERPDLGVSVLTSMVWPLDSVENTSRNEEGGALKCIYPPAVERIKTSFEDWYKQRHSGRRITWLPQLGTADIRATFTKVPTKEGVKVRRHELNVPTYCMIILMLFNDLPADRPLTFEEIHAQTNIPKGELTRNLQSLAVASKTRVLIKTPMSKEINPTDQFTFNEGFVTKFVRLKIGLVSGNKVEGDRERKETERKNDGSRIFIIEAALVRIMKQRKELSHSELVSQALQQLSSQFKPEVSVVKKRIEALMEREYLERIEDSSPPAYRYLA